LDNFAVNMDLLNKLEQLQKM